MSLRRINKILFERSIYRADLVSLRAFQTIIIIIFLLQSQGRCEIMLTLTKVVAGIGSAGSNCYKDIYKAAKPCMTDRAMTVRSAAAKVPI